MMHALWLQWAGEHLSSAHAPRNHGCIHFVAYTASLPLTWTHLGSFGLIGTHLGSFGLTLAQLDCSNTELFTLVLRGGVAICMCFQIFASYHLCEYNTLTLKQRFFAI